MAITVVALNGKPSPGRVPTLQLSSNCVIVPCRYLSEADGQHNLIFGYGKKAPAHFGH
ncbi:uncharacterized protein CLUP02_11077 [Colletotrichum lupini]|uniref:Uncharacterized protein n=1 Tax=Colletotrichum lupini TaxID=145971 RepID=A0A9Q8SYJ1_9PEZI|nr:uncharacterized protein CLUP02_11077 [Colletotrichum lupini]UQC85578.1 hypothetical protein CLUP02_11077 [Colletotrichum lupini]